MTIAELLDLVLESSPNYDEEFSDEFQAKVSQACADRTALSEAGNDPEAAAQYVSSWSEVVSVFANDPTSLAALTAPQVHIENLVCASGIRQVFFSVGPLPTMIQLLYDSATEQSMSLAAEVKPSVKKPILKRKPTKKSKKQIKAKSTKKGKAKPKAKGKAKTASKKAKKSRRRS